jgi:hypothetical protein
MHPDSLALARQILRGVVGEHHIRLVHGVEQRQDETPRFVEVCVGQTQAPETTTGKRKAQSTQTEVQTRLDRVGVPYAVCGDTVIMLNDDLSWPMDLVGVPSHE